MCDATAPPRTPPDANPPPYSVTPPQTESAHVTALGRHGREDAIVTRTKHDGNVTVTATYTATYNESAVRRFIRRRRMLSIISFIVSLLIVLGVLIPVVILPALRDSSGSSTPGHSPTSKSKWTYSKATGKCYRLTSTQSFDGGVSACENLGGKAVSIHSAGEEDAVVGVLKASDEAACFIGLSYPAQSTYESDKWVWADGTPFDFTAWTDAEPLLTGGGQPINKCVTLGQGLHGWINGYPCDSPQGMMCQKPPLSGVSSCE